MLAAGLGQGTQPSALPAQVSPSPNTAYPEPDAQRPRASWSAVSRECSQLLGSFERGSRSCTACTCFNRANWVISKRGGSRRPRRVH